MDQADFSRLRKFCMPEIITGIGARKLAVRYAHNLGFKKILIVSDAGVTQAGWVDSLIDHFREKKIPLAVFSRVSPNPRDNEVMEGFRFFEEERCDAILALGGGSVIDCAKGIGIVCSNRKSILDFEGVDRVELPMPPMICIPTTAGASADVSQFAIITDLGNKNKIAIISKAVIPDVSLIDPEVLTTMDSYLTACTGMDALVHAVEAFVSTAHSDLTDMHALEAIRLIHRFLHQSIAEPENLDYRSRMMQGSLLAGLAFSNASLGAVHAMAHSLGGYLDLPHGECNTILLPHIAECNHESAPERYRQILEAMQVETHKMTADEARKALFEEIVRMKQRVGIQASLGDRGVKSSDIPDLSVKAYRDPCLITNPRKLNQRDIEVLYGEAL